MAHQCIVYLAFMVLVGLFCLKCRPVLSPQGTDGAVSVSRSTDMSIIHWAMTDYYLSLSVQAKCLSVYHTEHGCRNVSRGNAEQFSVLGEMMVLSVSLSHQKKCNHCLSTGH